MKTKSTLAANEIFSYSVATGIRWGVRFSAHEAAARGKDQIKGMTEENIRGYLPGWTKEECAETIANRAARQANTFDRWNLED